LSRPEVLARAEADSTDVFELQVLAGDKIGDLAFRFQRGERVERGLERRYAAFSTPARSMQARE